jgi:hypothetical protein
MLIKTVAEEVGHKGKETLFLLNNHSIIKNYDVRKPFLLLLECSLEENKCMQQRQCLGIKQSLQGKKLDFSMQRLPFVLKQISLLIKKNIQNIYGEKGKR